MEKKIIVIGMDNSGKTTLVEYLGNKYSINVIRSLGPKATKEEMLNFLTENLEREEDLIFERFSVFEELVYGKILRGNSKFKYKETKEFKKYNPIIIYCRPSLKKIEDFGERAQMDGVIDKSKELIKRYDRLVRKLKKDGFNIIKYNYNNKKDLDKIEKIF